MRIWLVINVTAIALFCGVAAAQSTGDRWAADARTHVKAKRYQKAIDGYKRALAASPKNSYRCNIGVVYYKLLDWPRAHLFLAPCLANVSGLTPTFVAKARKAYTYAERELKKGAYGLVVVTVTPPQAKVTLSFLAADEAFVGSRAVWAPVGKHTIGASLKGFKATSRKVVVTKMSPATVTMHLASVPGTVASPAAPTSTEPPKDPALTKPAPTPKGAAVTSPPARAQPAPSPARVPLTSGAGAGSLGAEGRGSGNSDRRPAWIAFSVGALALAGGVVFHVKALGTVDDLEAERQRPTYDDKADILRRQQYWVGGLYGVAAVAGGIGTYLWFKRGDSKQPMVGTAVGRRRAAVWARWRM